MACERETTEITEGFENAFVLAGVHAATARTPASTGIAARSMVEIVKMFTYYGTEFRSFRAELFHVLRFFFWGEGAI